ncbi:MAG TPA: carboxylating nicotinate-nucleotide diphosphorylase [Acidiferrobacteraceae bacterium]|nr:carboxylating nicotinate-nucleotide diphosphorylase [Acidiferrobacteraceae bacterium]
MACSIVSVNVERALAEDVGHEDLSAALIPANAVACAHVLSRENAVLCGQAWFNEVFRQLDADITIEWSAKDGDEIAAESTICRLTGLARPLLTGERTALNFLQTLSATTTLTRQFVEAIKTTDAKVLDTRKTLPGLRQALKYAVRCGGGNNHRMGLYDGILIKENHIHAAGSLSAAIDLALSTTTKGVLIEIEVENLEMLSDALNAGATRILLDNFTIDELRQAVQKSTGSAKLEASGNIGLDNIRTVAETGVDYISVGALTKNIRAIDLSMRFEGA